MNRLKAGSADVPSAQRAQHAKFFSRFALSADEGVRAPRF